MRQLAIRADFRRAVYCLIDDGVPDIPLVGVQSLHSSAPSHVQHRHRGILEINYLESGQLVWHVGAKEYTQKGNEVFLAFPDEIHGAGGKPRGGGMLYWMQVQLPESQLPFAGLSAERASPLVESLRDPQARQFRGTQRLQALFEEIIRVHLQGQDDVLHTLRIAGLVQLLLLTVVECAQGSTEALAFADIQRVIERIQSRPEERISPADLARSIGMSPSNFNRKFKVEAGMPPGRYILQCKVECARRLLEETDLSVTEIAHRLGFSSSQYFATVFKRVTRMAPRDTRRSRTPELQS